MPCNLHFQCPVTKFDQIQMRAGLILGRSKVDKISYSPLGHIASLFCPRHAASIFIMDSIKTAYSTILESIGEDLNRDGLRDTPARAAKAIRFLTQGYDQTLTEVLNGAVFESDSDEMVIVRNIELYSLCEHHLLPFIGKCHVAYLPHGKVIGLSKVARIVDMYARRLQIQESLTKQIADAVLEVTGGRGVGVIIESQHMCMMMRGVEKQNSSMTTSAMLGTFRSDINTRNEFLSLVKG